MQCTFCNGKLYRQLFTCDQHQEVISCRGCRQYDCYRCKAELRKVQLQFCAGCRDYQPAKKTFGTQHYLYCLDCCTKAYKSNIHSKKVPLCKHIFQPDKYEVYKFLKRYCYQCRRDMSSEKIENLDSGLKQIFPLDINLCQKCSADNAHKENNFSSHTSSRVSQSHTFESHTSKQLKESKSNFAPQVVQGTKKQSVRSFPEPGSVERAQEKWKKIQNTDYLRCLTCGHLLLGDGLITDDIVICKFCMNWSNHQESEISLKNSRDVTRSRHKEQNSNINSSKIEKEYSEQQKRSSYFQNPHSGPTVSTYLKQNLPKIPSRRQEVLTKMRSEEEPMQSIPVSVRYAAESELVQCSKCGIRMEIDASIWEETLNKPICRCCFTQMLEVIQKQRQRYASPFRKQEEYGYRNSQKRNGSPFVKNYQQPEISRSPLGKNDKNGRVGQPPTQPIIKQESEIKINKVKRVQSWDETIIVEPVEDHEKRKQQNGKQEKNKVIVEISEEEAQGENKAPEYTQPVIVEDEVYKNQNVTLKKVFNQEQNQPIIIEETVESKRVKKMDSWEEQIILEPVADHIHRTEKSASDENSKQNPSPKSSIFQSQMGHKSQKRQEQVKIKKVEQKNSAGKEDQKGGRKYKEAKDLLQKQINDRFGDLSRMSGQESSKDYLSNSRSTAYSGRHNQEKKQSYINPNQGNYPQNPYRRKQEGLRNYPTYSSRPSEYYRPVPSPYVQKQRVGLGQTSQRREPLTGYRTLERREVKVCEFCRNFYETGFRDYYFLGYNVCRGCFDSNNSPPLR